MVSDGLFCPSNSIGNKKKLWALIPRQAIGATQHGTLGDCEWSIVLIDELVPDDLIPSLGRGPEQKGGVLKKHLMSFFLGQVIVNRVHTAHWRMCSVLCQLPIAACGQSED